MLRDVLGRTGDVSQLALGVGILRPLFQWLRTSRPDLVARMRHEPFAARGSDFVRSVGALEKAAFLAKMLGTDGGWGARRESDEAVAPGDDTDCAPEEMLFAGDVLFPGALDAESLSDALRARIARASTFVVNLEGTVGEQAHEMAPLLTARGIRQLLAYERDSANTDWVSRIDVAGLRALLESAPRALVSVANNHTLDDGLAGFERTVDLVRRAGVGVIGDARGGDGAALVDIGPHRVGLFAMSYGSNRARAGHACHLRFDEVPYRLSRAGIEEIVARLHTRGATHVIALLHWGYEHEHEPAPEQRRCVDLMFDAGVSAVIGHHPHLVQPSETRAGRWVSYSLGDFVGGDRTVWSRFSAIVSMRFGPVGAVRAELIPIAQTPFWKRHRTMLLADAPAFDRAVFDRWFGTKMLCPVKAA